MIELIAFSETEKYENFDETLQLMRLRYVISKMALRVKRYSYDKLEYHKCGETTMYGINWYCYEKKL